MRYRRALAAVLFLALPVSACAQTVRAPAAASGGTLGSAGAALPDPRGLPQGGLPLPPSGPLGLPPSLPGLTPSAGPAAQDPVPDAPLVVPGAPTTVGPLKDADAATGLQAVQGLPPDDSRDPADEPDGQAAAALFDGSHAGGPLAPVSPATFKRRLARLEARRPAGDFDRSLLGSGVSPRLLDGVHDYVEALKRGGRESRYTAGSLDRVAHMLAADVRHTERSIQKVTSPGAGVVVFITLSTLLGFDSQKPEGLAFAELLQKESGVSVAMLAGAVAAQKRPKDPAIQYAEGKSLDAQSTVFIKRWLRRARFAVQATYVLEDRERLRGMPDGGLRRLEQNKLLDSPYLPWLRAADQDAIRAVYREAGLETERSYPDSTVEIETPSFRPLVRLLTTPDGTMGPVIGGLTPGQLRGIDVTTPWSRLSPLMRLSVLQVAARHKRPDFWKDRRMFGLRLKPSAVLRFARETVFRGKTYPAGRHRVDLSRVFRDPIEFANYNIGPEAMELHYRDDQSAGAVNQDAWTVVQGLGLPADSHHIHIVAPLPQEALRARPGFQGLRMAEFTARVNLWAEMTGIVEAGAGIHETKDRRAVHGGHLKSDMLPGMFFWFRAVGRGRIRPLLDAFKTLWVGLRGPDRYDRGDVYGLEFRAAMTHIDPILLREGLDRIQDSMLKDDYGLHDDLLKRWLAYRPAWVKRPQKALPASWYNRPWPEVLRTAPSLVSLVLKQMPKEIRGAFLQALTQRKENTELKMLVHDWSTSPLFFEASDEYKNAIIELQILSLVRIARGEPVPDVMRDFLVFSGIYQRVGASLGIDDR